MLRSTEVVEVCHIRMDGISFSQKEKRTVKEPLLIRGFFILYPFFTIFESLWHKETNH